MRKLVESWARGFNEAYLAERRVLAARFRVEPAGARPLPDGGVGGAWHLGADNPAPNGDEWAAWDAVHGMVRPGRVARCTRAE